MNPNWLKFVFSVHTPALPARTLPPRPVLDHHLSRRSPQRLNTPQQIASKAPTEAEGSFQLGVALAIFGTFLFALKSVFIKLAFAEGATPSLILFLRLLFSLPFYVGILFWLQRGQADREVQQKSWPWRAAGLGFFGYYLASYLDLAGLEYVSAQLERVTLFTYPVIIAVLAWVFLKETLSSRMLVALGLCFVGVVLMYFEEDRSRAYPDAWFGILLVMLAALSYSAYVLLSKPLMQKMGSSLFTCWAMIGSSFFVLVHFFATEQANVLASTSANVYGYSLILAVVCTVLPSFMINRAILKIGAGRTSVIGSLGPVLTILLAAAVLAEPLSALRLLGVGLAIVGVAQVTKK